MSEMRLIDIRPLTNENTKECQQIWAELASHYDHPIGGTWTGAKIAEEISNHNGLGVFGDGDQLEAFCLFRVYDDKKEIMLLATRPRIHRTGAMRALMRAFIEELAATETLWLEVHAGNLPAISLYESLGFKLVGERPEYYSDGSKALLFEYKPLQ